MEARALRACLHASPENSNIRLKLYACACAYTLMSAKQRAKTGCLHDRMSAVLLLSMYPHLKSGDECSEELNMFILNKIQHRARQELMPVPRQAGHAVSLYM